MVLSFMPIGVLSQLEQNCADQACTTGEDHDGFSTLQLEKVSTLTSQEIIQKMEKQLQKMEKKLQKMEKKLEKVSTLASQEPITTADADPEDPEVPTDPPNGGEIPDPHGADAGARALPEGTESLIDTSSRGGCFTLWWGFNPTSSKSKWHNCGHGNYVASVRQYKHYTAGIEGVWCCPLAEWR